MTSELRGFVSIDIKRRVHPFPIGNLGQAVLVFRKIHLPAPILPTFFVDQKAPFQSDPSLSKGSEQSRSRSKGPQWSIWSAYSRFNAFALTSKCMRARITALAHCRRPHLQNEHAFGRRWLRSRSFFGKSSVFTVCSNSTGSSTSRTASKTAMLNAASRSGAPPRDDEPDIEDVIVDKVAGAPPMCRSWKRKNDPSCATRLPFDCDSGESLLSGWALVPSKCRPLESAPSE